MKIFKWFSDNVLLLITLFLLAFIPLYPKLPLLDVKHTWVYIRVEDFLVLIAVFAWFIQLIRKKAGIKTPLTIPIVIFWLVGLISTVYAIYFIFPSLLNVFPSVAWLHYLRRIEYISLFFVAYFSIRDKKFIYPIITVLVATLCTVVFYGIGQRFFGFPAFLTMNEEFAKGIPLRLSEYSRVPSTFAGHYDLAAYLVLMIPLIGSLFFGFKNIFAKLLMLVTAFLGLILLLMTESRVSFAVYLITVIILLVIQKKKKFILPVIIVSLLLLNFFQGISERFASTITQVDLVVDARTGKPVGIATQSVDKTGVKKTSKKTDKKAQPVVIEEIQSTGENLPQGTGYISFPSEPTEKTITQVFYKRLKVGGGEESDEITSVEGNFVVKKALAYDVSFTTRFQGEWPRAIDALNRNIFTGSGYSSISLATDNNYLRILGEIGVLGLVSFLSIFFVMGIYIKKVIDDVDSKVVKSFVLGFVAGIFGLGLNAVLIDVFEASKVAFVLWLLVGITLGILHLYKKRKINYFKEFKELALSSTFLIIYIFLIAFGIFWMIFGNFFVGDDFTWLKWAADCKKVLYKSGLVKCEPPWNTIANYFTNSDGFFYRPGAKIYFYITYAIFWLNPVAYHVFSVILHAIVSSLVFIISKKILKSKLFAFIVALFFLVLGSHSEVVYWISSTGHLISVVFILFGLLFYILWKEKKAWVYLVFSVLAVFLAPLFYELGIIAPLLIIAYEIIMRKGARVIINSGYYLIYLVSIPIYLWVRNISQSHWLSGDYNYNLLHFPYNFFGNIFGYLGLVFFGTKWLDFYQKLRLFGKSNPIYIVIAIVIILVVLYSIYRFLIKKLGSSDRKVVLISIAIFILALLPYLGLGNISIRYVYLASFGALLLFVFIIKLIFDRLFLFRNKFYSISFLVICVGLFLVFNIYELIRINEDWKRAGSITSKLLVDFNETFAKTKAATYNPVFYFTNVPIKKGEAWVFPVGLPDALWFTFQYEYLKVNISPSLDLALDAAEGSSSAKVFEFDNNGNVEQVFRTKKTITVPIENK
ncbi:MAG: O-antigen ligase family protein [Patescibacteria group bacterium]|nr:O-antigen ligase family protein [Patescibacteria group bacterium]